MQASFEMFPVCLDSFQMFEVLSPLLSDRGDVLSPLLSDRGDVLSPLLSDRVDDYSSNKECNW